MRNFSIKNSSIFVLTVLLIFPVLFNSCKKDQTTTGGYFMKFDVDGTLVQFTEQSSLIAAFSGSGNQFNALFTGYTGTSNMGLQVFDSKAISAATYSGYTVSNSALVGALISYQDNSGTVFTQGSGNSDAVVRISEMTATTVRGTFSGTLSSSGKPDIHGTNGEFFVWHAN